MHVGLLVCLPVCLSIRARNSKMITPIDLILYAKYYTSDSLILQDDPDLDSRVY